MKTLAAIFGSIFYIVFWAYIGTVFWPFASWLTDTNPVKLIHYFALISIFALLIVRVIMQNSTLVGAAPAGLFLMSLLVITCIINLKYIENRFYMEYSYHNGFAIIGEYRHMGLMNKFGKTVIEPKYSFISFKDGKWIAELETIRKSEVYILNEEDLMMEKIFETNRHISRTISEDRFITRERNGGLYYVESSRGTLFGGYEDIDYDDDRDIFECEPGEESTYDYYDYDGYRTEKK